MFWELKNKKDQVVGLYYILDKKNVVLYSHNFPICLQ